MLTGGLDIIFIGDSLKIDELVIDSEITIFDDITNDIIAIYKPCGYKWQTIEDGKWEMTNNPLGRPILYNKELSIENAMRLFVNNEKFESADDIISCSALYKEWIPGEHITKEIYTEEVTIKKSGKYKRDRQSRKYKKI